MWDVDRYLRYETERARPFFELVRAVKHPHPVAVADLGCGPGGLTATLLTRWPEAAIWGVDSSREMIAHARRLAVIGRLHFECADAAVWRPPRPLDVIISNACFQWIPDHRRLRDPLLPQLAPAGVLAFQVPANSDQPTHTVPWGLMEEPPWRDLVAGAQRPSVETAQWYLEELAGCGFEVDAWETTYYHVLSGDDPVLAWLEGTTLRPALEVLDDKQRKAFLAACAERLRAAYPPGPMGTIFPFRRLFVVARRPG